MSRYLLSALLLVSFCDWATAAGAQPGPSVTGTASYRERMLLPPGAVFEATLEDVSRADVPATVIARSRITDQNTPPFRFSLAYDAARIVATHRYAVRARITADGQLMFTTDTSYAVLAGQPTNVDVLLRRVATTPTPTPATPAAPGQLPATFIGDLPCADCQGLRYHLDLFVDGAFFLRRSYLGKRITDSQTLGRWSYDAGSRYLRLASGTTALEQFELQSDGGLRKLDTTGRPIDSKLNYTLARQASFAPIEPQQALRGMYTYTADSGVFTECLTKMKLPVAQEGGNAALEAAYGKTRKQPGDALLATVTGRIAMRQPMEGRPRPTLVVEQFDSVIVGNCDTPQSTANLENTYWKLMRLGGAAVTVAEQQREPYIILQSGQNRVAGSGGCNRLMGSYTLSGMSLKLSQLAGTMMACPQGMDIEQKLHGALPNVAQWRIHGETLELLDAAGTVVALFESRYMR